MMSNNNYYISFVVAFILGLGLGVYLEGNKGSAVQSRLEADRKKLELKLEVSEDSIGRLDSLLVRKDSVLSSLSGKIDTLQLKLKYAKPKVEKKREEAKKLTASQKETWLMARYDSLPILKPDSVTVSDTVAARVIDDLILKDALEYETKVKDTIINEYAVKDSTYQSAIETHKAKDAEQDTIISTLKTVNHDLLENEKESRRRNFKLKLIIIGEAILLVLALL